MTLIEVSLVAVMLAVIAAMVMPNFFLRVKQQELPTSANQMRSLLTMVRAHAQFDTKRYRIRFLDEDEIEDEEWEWVENPHQPIIEREDDPIDEAGVYNVVAEPWAVGDTFLGEIWCVEVRIGKPSLEELQMLQQEEPEDFEKTEIKMFENLDPYRPPLYIEPDGTSEWATFVVTDAPKDVQYDELPDYSRIEVIYDGEMGLVWLQRPLYEEELDLFEEKNWPVVFRQDFLRKQVLTEDDVLELMDIPVQ